MRRTDSLCRSRVWSTLLTACVAVAAVASTTTISRADEDGVSFWIPGFFSSLAATPQQPGWSLTSILYNSNVSASGNAAVAREITIGDFPKNTVNISGSAHVHADATIGFVAPSYVFANPFLGGQAAATLLFGYGNNDTSLNATATATADLLGGPVSITRSIARQQDTTGFTDLIPMFVDRWNAGVNNYMAYITGDIPVGLYSSSNLSNIGVGHGRSTEAWATPISTRNSVTSSRRLLDSPATSKIPRVIPTESISTSIGAPRNFCPSS